MKIPPVDLQKLAEAAAKFAKDHGEKVDAVLRRWRIDKPPPERAEELMTAVNFGDDASSSLNTLEPSRPSCGINFRDGGQIKAPLLDLTMKEKRPILHPIKMSKRPKPPAPPWRPVNVVVFLGDGTLDGSYKARLRVYDNHDGKTMETVVLRLGRAYLKYARTRFDVGDKTYFLDTKERGTAETLQFVRGHKRLVGTWRTKSACGGWCIAFR